MVVMSRIGMSMGVWNWASRSSSLVLVRHSKGATLEGGRRWAPQIHPHTAERASCFLPLLARLIHFPRLQLHEHDRIRGARARALERIPGPFTDSRLVMFFESLAQGFRVRQRFDSCEATISLAQTARFPFWLGPPCTLYGEIMVLLSFLFRYDQNIPKLSSATCISLPNKG
jgi:hypothetical protein